MLPNRVIRFFFHLGVITLGLLGYISTAAADNRLNVYVVNYPLKYFAERIGGGHVRVTFPVPPDVDPAYWAPNIAEIGAFQQADVILLNGGGYAGWVANVSLPRSKTVDTARRIKDRLIPIEAVATHSHGAGGEHAHEGFAFTTWLDFSLAAEQARAVAQAFIRKRPQYKAVFEAGSAALEKDLLNVDRRLKAIASRNPSLPLVVSHPVYDYFTRRYDLNTRSVHWEPDQAPTRLQINGLAKIIAKHPARWMLWEGEPVPEAVKKLSGMGVGSIVFNPCGNVPATGDFLTVMLANIINIEPVFQ